MPKFEAEKFPVSATEVETVDMSVFEEEFSVKDKRKTSLTEFKLHADTNEDKVDEWPDDDDTVDEP